MTVPEEAFSAYDPVNLEVLPLLVQTGYLAIREKRYFERFLGDSRRLTLIGVGFSRKTRNVSRWLVEPV